VERARAQLGLERRVDELVLLDHRAALELGRHHAGLEVVAGAGGRQPVGG
jgi:hypothetical protein